MKKIVLKSEINCDEDKRKALQAISRIEGVDSVKIDLKEKIITVIGEADPVLLTRKLRKFRHTELMSVGPVEKVRRSTRIDILNQVDQIRSPNHCQRLSASGYHDPNACSIS